MDYVSFTDQHLQSWTKAVETLPTKNLFSWTREFFNPQFSHFHPLSPFQWFNHMTVSMECISTLKRGRGGFGYQQKRCFFSYRRMPIESICLTQMCQHFCPWLQIPMHYRTRKLQIFDWQTYETTWSQQTNYPRHFLVLKKCQNKLLSYLQNFVYTRSQTITECAIRLHSCKANH